MKNVIAIALIWVGQPAFAAPVDCLPIEKARTYITKNNMQRAFAAPSNLGALEIWTFLDNSYLLVEVGTFPGSNGMPAHVGCLLGRGNDADRYVAATSGYLDWAEVADL